MDVLEAELAVLVSETEEEVLKNQGDATVIPSRSAKPAHGCHLLLSSLPHR